MVTMNRIVFGYDTFLQIPPPLRFYTGWIIVVSFCYLGMYLALVLPLLIWSILLVLYMCV